MVPTLAAVARRWTFERIVVWFRAVAGLVVTVMFLVIGYTSPQPVFPVAIAAIALIITVWVTVRALRRAGRRQDAQRLTSGPYSPPVFSSRFGVPSTSPPLITPGTAFCRIHDRRAGAGASPRACLYSAATPAANGAAIDVPL